MQAAEPQVAGGASMSGVPTALVLTEIERFGPVKIAAIADRLWLSRRDVEAAVEALRLEGHPIVGGNDGLRLTEDPAVLEPYIDQRRRRGASLHRGTLALRRTLRRMRERHELTLFDLEHV